MAEIWKSIPGWEGYYEVSDQGRVRRIAPGPGARAGRILSPRPVRGGYLMVRLCRKGYTRNCQVHRLVLSAFVGECPIGMEANHLNGIHGDNRLPNLEWVTRQENIIHSFRVLGRRSLSRSNNPGARLSESDVAAIKSELKCGLSYNRIAGRYGVTKGTIAHIAQGRTWKGE